MIDLCCCKDKIKSLPHYLIGVDFTITICFKAYGKRQIYLTLHFLRTHVFLTSILRPNFVCFFFENPNLLFYFFQKRLSEVWETANNMCKIDPRKSEFLQFINLSLNIFYFSTIMTELSLSAN
jgi:hypothetical protein